MASNAYANLGDYQSGGGYSKPVADWTYYPPTTTDPIRENFRYDPFSGVSTSSVAAAGTSHSVLGLALLAGIVIGFEFLRSRRR